MDLANLVKTVVHHLLIGGMTCVGRQDGFSMVSALMYVMHTNAKLLIIMIYQVTILYELLSLRGY